MSESLMRVSFEKEFPDLGKKIRTARQESGKTLTELAYAAGISVNHWVRIENEGVKLLPETVLRGIEKALNIDLEVSYWTKGKDSESEGKTSPQKLEYMRRYRLRPEVKDKEKSRAEKRRDYQRDYQRRRRAKKAALKKSQENG